MGASDHYSIDTSALIDWWVRYYPPAVFKGLVPRMEALVQAGRLRASREVRDELEPRNDDCFKWSRNQPNFFVESDESIQSIVAQLMKLYFNPAKPEKGIGAADPFVISLAAVRTPNLGVVVTGEKQGSVENPKIPWVCKNLQPQAVRTISFLDLIIEEGWQLS